AVAWTYTRNGTANNNDNSFGLALDASDNVFATGMIVNTGTNTDLITVKLDGATGAESWRREVHGGPNDQGQAIAIDPAGNPITAGFLRGAGSIDFLLLKLNGATGTTMFQRTIDGAGGAAGEALAVTIDSDSNVLAAGFIDPTGLSPDFVVLKASGVNGGDITCGDAVVAPGEDCEDGNTANGDCCSSTCRFEKPTVVCRPSAGICDTEETCTGSSGTCPADAKSTAICRPSLGVCDVDEVCDGVSNDCPADVLASPSTVCRPSAGVCDVDENCTGSNVDCPADVFVPSSTVCRASAGVCDVAENCTGSSPPCPADLFLPSSTPSR